MDLTNHRLIVIKGFLFLVGALLASGLLLVEVPRLKVALLLAIAIWCACRFYYFAFYVIEKYVDREYRFTGLISFARWLITSRRRAA